MTEKEPKKTEEESNPLKIVVTPEFLERARRAKETIRKLEDATSIQAIRSIDNLIIDL